MSRVGRQALIVALCATLTLFSGITVVYTKYVSRKHFSELQGLRAERELLQIEWGRLQLERGTLATHWRVETMARERLSMRMPAAEEIVVITP